MALVYARSTTLVLSILWAEHGSNLETRFGVNIDIGVGNTTRQCPCYISLVVFCGDEQQYDDMSAVIRACLYAD